MTQTAVPDGEWTTEPDQESWIDEATGYECQIKRTPKLGILCGYVLVPKEHPDFGSPLSAFWQVRVHGGVTCAETEGDRHRIGFDCGHVWDQMPIWVAQGMDIPDTTYRNFAYVREQCESLARQLKAREG